MSMRDKQIYGAILGQTPANTHPEHAYFYDNHDRINRTLYYRRDGTLRLAKEFDEQGKALSLQLSMSTATRKRSTSNHENPRNA